MTDRSLALAATGRRWSAGRVGAAIAGGPPALPGWGRFFEELGCAGAIVGEGEVMGLVDVLVHPIRHVAAALRHNTRRVARVATRFNRAGLYIWDVIVWSRVEAARSGLISLELPESVLAKKHVLAGPPTLRVRALTGRLEHFNDGFAAVNVILFGNLQRPDVLSAHRYALPGPAFRGVYLWDSAFIAQIWRWWDRGVAGDVLRSVVALRDGDRLQHVVADFIQSAFTQPPLIAWSLAALVEDGADNALAAELYPALTGYHGWLLKHRRLSDGLFAWQHPYESGIDNSPRFSNRDESRFKVTTGTAAPDFSTYMVLQCEALAALARKVGHDADAAQFAKEADEIRAAMNARLWHEEDGCYYDRDHASGEWVRVRTIAALLPLWAGVPDEKKARRMLAQIIDPQRFGTLIPFPSVARDERSYELDMWRGPVWVNTAYGALLGLQRYGFHREMAELGWRLCEGVYHVFAEKRQIYEFYDPSVASIAALARKRGNWWKRLTLGGGPQREFVGWSGLVNTVMITLLFGFARHGGRRLLRPAFPAAAAGTVLRLSLPAEQLTIEVAVETPEMLRCFVQGPQGLRTFSAAFAETVDLDALLELPASPAAAPP